jgi:heme-degrading monooxygenase HmoA
VIVLLRFDVAAQDEEQFQADARTALEVLAALPGWRSGRVGRAADEASRWVLLTEWDGAGAYRRAISSHEVKLRLVPFLSRALDEPTAYEVVQAVDGAQVP